MKSLHFFTGKEGEWRLKVADDGEVVEASKGAQDWLGERLRLDTIAERRRPFSVSGRRFPRAVDLVLDLDAPPAPPVVTFVSPACVHFTAPAGKAVKP